MKIFQLLFLAFLAIPLIEIYLLIKVGGLIGAVPTVAAVVLTAVIGAVLLRIQGLTTLQRVRDSFERGEIPAVGMVEGMVLLVAGALLLTPGFFTDTIGFLCLVPPLRRAVIAHLLERSVVRASSPPGGPGGANRPHPTHTLEGEFRRDD